MFLTPILQHLPVSRRMNVADEKYPDVVQDNWEKLRSALDRNSDIFNTGALSCSKALRRKCEELSAFL